MSVKPPKVLCQSQKTVIREHYWKIFLWSYFKFITHQCRDLSSIVNDGACIHPPLTNRFLFPLQAQNIRCGCVWTARNSVLHTTSLHSLYFLSFCFVFSHHQTSHAKRSEVKQHSKRTYRERENYENSLKIYWIFIKNFKFSWKIIRNRSETRKY